MSAESVIQEYVDFIQATAEKKSSYADSVSNVALGNLNFNYQNPPYQADPSVLYVSPIDVLEFKPGKPPPLEYKEREFEIVNLNEIRQTIQQNFVQLLQNFLSQYAPVDVNDWSYMRDQYKDMLKQAMGSELMVSEEASFQAGVNRIRNESKRLYSNAFSEMAKRGFTGVNEALSERAFQADILLSDNIINTNLEIIGNSINNKMKMFELSLNGLMECQMNCLNSGLKYLEIIGDSSYTNATQVLRETSTESNRAYSDFYNSVQVYLNALNGVNSLYLQSEQVRANVLTDYAKSSISAYASLKGSQMSASSGIASSAAGQASAALNGIGALVQLANTTGS